MQIKYLISRVAKSLKNLSKLERFLLFVRLASLCSAFVFGLVALIGPVFNNGLYMTRINTAHLEVSNGLYNSLRNSVSSASSILGETDSGYAPMGDSLTNSEIKLLTDYAEAQVAGAPQYCTSTLWTWCIGDYDTYNVIGRNGKVVQKKKNEVLTCTKKTHYTLDYRLQLEAMGLESILAYAYETQVLKNSQYDQAIDKRTNRLTLALNGVIFLCCAELVLLFSTLVIYSNRGNERDLSKIPNVVLHALAVVSVMACLSSIIGSSVITNLLLITKNEVSQKLDDFGVRFERGATWFTLLWFSTVCSIISMFSWGLPMWCANPPQEERRHKLEDSVFVGRYTQYF
ncbi:hypothetical protein LELG_05801 [Lodderomyces elongisporus NRRL YB-4239]|uniref:Protein ECM7 n=1 Tax=Lodderomyces elongisporus (strain ATCC 11503 / CBS 2605 / JCM 1781 / NBRC 1676 / NRRL YB-4239) TaxID=379508 RepID=A5H2T6_LODEL|nr:hypothetical protein LELG_05801 [Lodderomyces elongisporus NRRL YB-4239]